MVIFGSSFKRKNHGIGGRGRGETGGGLWQSACAVAVPEGAVRQPWRAAKRRHFSGIGDALKQALEEPCDAAAEPTTRFEALARAMVAQAERDPCALKLLLQELKQ
jgi:hypothetical protein